LTSNSKRPYWNQSPPPSSINPARRVCVRAIVKQQPIHHPRQQQRGALLLDLLNYSLFFLSLLKFFVAKGLALNFSSIPKASEENQRCFGVRNLFWSLVLKAWWRMAGIWKNLNKVNTFGIIILLDLKSLSIVIDLFPCPLWFHLTH